MTERNWTELLIAAEGRQRAGDKQAALELCQRIGGQLAGQLLAVDADRLDPLDPDGGLKLRFGALLYQLGQTRPAIELLEHLTQRWPARAAAWFALGAAWQGVGEHAAACDCFRRSLKHAPQEPSTHHNLGQSLFELGQIDEAIEQLKQAIASGAGAKSETLLAVICPHSSRYDDAAILRVRREFARRCLPPCVPTGASPRNAGGRDARPADRPLRVGYVSSYFRHENWMKPVWGLVNRHERQRFRVTLFSDTPQSDEQAPLPGYQPHSSDRVLHCRALSNAEFARAIAAQQLDLLIDLNGYGDAKRLGIYRARPAPVIAGWFNTFATTGLECFDYVIGDWVVVPTGEEPNYIERVLRVPGCYLTYEVQYAAPDVARPPSLPATQEANDSPALTFGSLTSLYKMTPEVIAVWAKILHACPHCRLFLKNKGLSAASNARYLREAFARQGIDAARIEFSGSAPHFEFLQAYDRIDIALDTFPYTGGTTTSEALWQGVPVLTLTGDRWLPRVSASLLASAGLTEWITDDVGQYVELARYWARDEFAATFGRVARCAPSALACAPVCDLDRFARAMETLYVQMIEQTALRRGR